MNTPQATVLAYFQALNRGDADAAADLFTSDGVLMPHQFDTISGQEGIRGALHGMFQDMKVVAAPEVGDTREDGDWAFVLAKSSGSLEIIVAGISQPADHRELFALNRTEGGWRIAYYMFNDPMGLPE